MISGRAFLRVSGVGATTFLGLRVDRANAEGPPETAWRRFVQRPVICFAPLYVADPLFRRS